MDREVALEAIQKSRQAIVDEKLNKMREEERELHKAQVKNQMNSELFVQ